MIRTCCDSCSNDIDRSKEWFGVDHWEPTTGLEDDDDDGEPGDNTYHFCSAECMSAWAFSEAVE